MRAAAGRPVATQRVSCARGCVVRKRGQKKAQRRSAPALALTAPSEPSQSWKSTAVPSAAEDALRCQQGRARLRAQKRSALTGPLPLHSRAGVGEADDAVAVVGVDSGRGRGAANGRRSSAVSNSRRAVDGSFLVVFVAEEATAGGKKRGQGKADRANRGTAEGWDRGAHAWSSEAYRVRVHSRCPWCSSVTLSVPSGWITAKSAQHEGARGGPPESRGRLPEHEGEWAVAYGGSRGRCR